MIWAFGRLIAIGLGALIWIFLTVFSLRYFGEQQKFSPLHHSLVDDHHLWLVARGGDTDQGRVAQTHAALLAAYELTPEIFLGLDLRLTVDNHWVLYAPKNLEELTTGHGYVSQFTLDEIEKLNYKGTTERILTLDEVVNEWPRARLWINIIQPANAQLKSLTDLFNTSETRSRVVFTSPFMDTLHELRNQSPDWLTAATTSEIAKARLMTSIWLETLMELPGEVMVFDQINDRLIAEMVRRQKVVLLATDDAALFSTLSNQLHLSGVVTKRPSQFVQMVAQP